MEPCDCLFAMERSLLAFNFSDLPLIDSLIACAISEHATSLGTVPAYTKLCTKSSNCFSNSTDFSDLCVDS